MTDRRKAIAAGALALAAAGVTAFFGMRSAAPSSPELAVEPGAYATQQAPGEEALPTQGDGYHGGAQ